MLSSLSEERRDPDDNKMARPSQSRCGCAFGRRKLTLSATPLGKDHLWGVRAPSSNEVQVPLSRAGDDPSSLAVELDEAGLLELLADVTDNAAANLAKVLRPHALPVRGSVNLSELSDTDSLLEVDLPGDARGAHVVPVWVVGTQLLVAPGLDEVNVLAWSKLQREREREKRVYFLVRQTFLSFPRSPVPARARGCERAGGEGEGARGSERADRRPRHRER
mmetsp:Transcript_2699/g.9275  ORF Transcript_2699/g.9275 Transcript_2699/m.9275 type:complete len:221 (-) Transcript_2699:227-889(-)